MFKLSLVRFFINLSSVIQTSLVNYLEFNRVEPRILSPSDYLILSPRPEKREELPLPFQKEQVQRPNYSLLLRIAEEQGHPINPIRRKTHLRAKVNRCRKCHAPPEYLRNHGFYRPKNSKKAFPRLTCKVCFAEYAPGAVRHRPKHRCPYCGYALNPKTYRKNYTVYYCERDACVHRKIHPNGILYSEKEWSFDYETLSCDLPGKTPRLQNIRLNKHILDLEMSLFVECGMSSREVVKILQKVYGNEIIKSHQTVLNHAKALALHLNYHEGTLPMPVGETVCEDETYVRAKGKWGYLFRAFNPENRAIISEYFSPHRDTKGCITLNKAVTEIYAKSLEKPAFDLITDQAPIYQAMRKYFKSKSKARITLHQVKGIFDRPGDENAQFRPEKQMIERSFESLKSAIKRRRNFSSFEGAQIFCFLHKVYYNHLRIHSELKNQPPIPLKMKSSQQVGNWNQLLEFISEKS